MYKPFDITKDISYADREVFAYVPVSGSVFESGTNGGLDKTFVRFYPNQIYSGSDSGSLFITYHDKAITDASAVPLFDATFGISTASIFYNENTTVYEYKNLMYEDYCDMCWGSRDTRFSVDTTFYDELFFIHFKRNIFKDEIRKGYTTLYTTFANAGGTGAVADYASNDAAAKTAFKEDHGGDWQYLLNEDGKTAGWVFYDLGLLVLAPTGTFGFYHDGDAGVEDDYLDYSGSSTYSATVAAQTIDQIVTWGFEKWDVDTYTHPLQEYSQLTMHSALFFCTAGPNEFNYSSNPSYVDADGRIYMTSGSKPTKAASYITTIGIYDGDNTLLATGKLSDPIKKSPDNGEIIRVRLNY